MVLWRQVKLTFRQNLIIGVATSISFGLFNSLPAYSADVDLIPSVLSATCSSERSGRLCAQAIDGVIDGYPADSSKEWSAIGKVGAWIRLDWAAPVSISKVVLHDRILIGTRVTAGIINFSDGSSVPVGALPDNGAALEVTFASRTVSWFRFDITQTSSATINTGLAEIKAYSTPINSPINYQGQVSSAVCSTERSGRWCVQAIDGVVDGYPTDPSKEWTSNEKAGAWIQLNFSTAVTLNQVILHDRINLNGQNTQGIITFSDGGSLPIGVLPNDGTGFPVDFASRSVTWLRYTITAVSSSTINSGLAEIVPRFVPSGTGPTGELFNEALFAFPVANVGEASMAQAHDGKTGVLGNGWVANGVGDTLELHFDGVKPISKLELADSVGTDGQITAATVSFSDGTSFASGILPTNGTVVAFDFARKNVSWVKVKLNSVSGTNVGLSEVAAYGVLDGQTLQDSEQFTNGATEWSYIDNTTVPSPSNWTVNPDGILQQTVKNFAQTADGFQLGTYALWNNFTHNAMDLRVRIRPIRSGKLETGVMGIIFGYQDDNNYYRLSLASHKGYRKLEKRVNGMFTQLAGSTARFEPNEWNNIRVVLMDGLINVYVDGQYALTAVDGSFNSGKIGLWNSWTENRTEYDNLFVLTAPVNRAVVGLTAPVEFAVQSGTAVVLAPQRAGQVSFSGYEMVADEGTTVEQKRNVGLSPSIQDLTFTFPGAGTHTIAVYGRNTQGQRFGTPESMASIAGIGVGGLKLVTIGDSITTGMFDTIVEDDVSIDSRNSSGGYQPILNDKLAQFYGIPVTVIDDSNPGDKATDGISKINSILARNGTANALLLTYGTNDSSGTNRPDPVVFKGHIKQIVDAVIASGKIGKVFIGRPGPRLGKPGQSNTIKGYNSSIKQLVAEYAVTNPGIVFLGPDFYTYFDAHRTEYDVDGIHYTGTGYQSMGELWYQVLKGKI